MSISEDEIKLSSLHLLTITRVHNCGKNSCIGNCIEYTELFDPKKENSQEIYERCKEKFYKDNNGKIDHDDVWGYTEDDINDLYKSYKRNEELKEYIKNHLNKD